MFICYFHVRSLSACIRQLMKFSAALLVVPGKIYASNENNDLEYVYFPVEICISKSLFANIS